MTPSLRAIISAIALFGMTWAIGSALFVGYIQHEASGSIDPFTTVFGALSLFGIVGLLIMGIPGLFWCACLSLFFLRIDGPFHILVSALFGAVSSMIFPLWLAILFNVPNEMKMQILWIAPLAAMISSVFVRILLYRDYQRADDDTWAP